MFCFKCGTGLDEGSLFCKKCGAKWGYISKPKSYGNEREFECKECGGDIIVYKR